MSFANVVLAVVVRIKVNLAGSSEAGVDDSDEEDVEVHGDERFGSYLSLLFVLLLLLLLDADC